MKKIFPALIVVLLAWVGPADGANLLLNGGFEDGFDSWDVFEPPAAERYIINTDEDFVRNGSQSLKFDSDGVPARVHFDVTTLAAGTPGVEYIAEAWYYLPETLLIPDTPWDNEALGIVMQFLNWDDSSWSVLGDPIQTFEYGPGPEGSGLGDETTVGEWALLSVSGTAPAGTNWVQVGLQATGIGSVFYYDDVSLIPEPGAAVLLLGAAAGIGFWRRRRARNRIAS